jgi:hypothetical protein
MGKPVETPMLWGQLGLGHVLLSEGRKWTVIDARTPEQYEYGRTAWLRVRAPNGEEHSIEPQRVKRRVTVLVDPDADPIEPVSHIHGSAEAALLVEQLGAFEIATRDERTGEIWCPWSHTPEQDITHLELAHGLDLSGLDPADLLARTKLHGKAHDIAYPLIGKTGGFPHRHVPEDLSLT